MRGSTVFILLIAILTTSLRRVLRISSDRDDGRIFLGLEILDSKIFWMFLMFKF